MKRTVGPDACVLWWLDGCQADHLSEEYAAELDELDRPPQQRRKRLFPVSQLPRYLLNGIQSAIRRRDGQAKLVFGPQHLRVSLKQAIAPNLRNLRTKHLTTHAAAVVVDLTDAESLLTMPGTLTDLRYNTLNARELKALIAAHRT